MNNMDPDLLKRYAAGKCNAAESQQVERWLADPDVQVDSAVFDGVDKDTLGQQIWDDIALEKRPSRRQRLIRYSYQIAACISIALCIGYLYQQFLTNPGEEFTYKYRDIHIASGKKVKVTLSDGTVVHVNGDSKFSFPEKFADHGPRMVSLSGEAYFEVAKDTTRPFVINSRGAKTTVLGTKFNLSAYPENKGTILTVDEGKVRFSEDRNESNYLIITAGKQGVCREGQKLETHEVYSPGYSAWKDAKMIIKNKSLDEICLLVKRWYGVDMVVQNKALQDARFTGTYADQSLDVLARDISDVMHCNYRLVDKTLTFY